MAGRRVDDRETMGINYTGRYETLKRPFKTHREDEKKRILFVIESLTTKETRQLDRKKSTEWQKKRFLSNAYAENTFQQYKKVRTE